MTSPLWCPQCGKTHRACKVKELQLWRDSGHDLCPACVARWGLGKPVNDRRPSVQCNGCGGKTVELKAGVCSKCSDAGVEALQLFEET